MKKVTCLEIEIAVAHYFNYRTHMIIPNIYWGAGLIHECDLLVINCKSHYATEVEIKVSKADLKKDFSKAHNHISVMIKNLYYAIPIELLETALELIPATAGILIYGKKHRFSDRDEIYRYRIAKPNHTFRKMTDEEMMNLGRLGCMRIWNLKRDQREKKKTLNGIKNGTYNLDGTLKLSENI